MNFTKATFSACRLPAHATGVLRRVLTVAAGSLVCLAATSGPAHADLKLAQSKTCMACHQVDRKVVGPSFKAIAGKYAGKAEMVDVLARKIRQGGGGVWGPVPMPANAQVSEADARLLSTWILQLK